MQTRKTAHLARRRERVCFRDHDGLSWRPHSTVCVRAVRRRVQPTFHSVFHSRLQTGPAPTPGQSEPYLSVTVTVRPAMKYACMYPVGCRVFALACATRGTQSQEPRASSLEHHGRLEVRVQPQRRCSGQLKAGFTIKPPPQKPRSAAVLDDRSSHERMPGPLREHLIINEQDHYIRHNRLYECTPIPDHDMPPPFVWLAGGLADWQAGW
ncbi:hypothetical protein B0T19DRAFT_175760 [Cercophora scortea]|uniref:Uncharacterized protein n=1 Tax=Cercophora scortea TaxID=314031 RepID=A0AAE0ME88_9PEZI|nr:hypothetical protein B0T19DRAFT_175760 [Cercophora scortea]